MMIPVSPELALVLSLLKQPGENAADALSRIASLTVDISPDHFSDRKCAEMFSAILRYAEKGIALTPQALAQVTDVDEGKLLYAIPFISADLYQTYADEVRRAAVDRWLGEIARIARSGDPVEDRIQQVALALASVPVDTDSCRSVHENTTDAIRWMRGQAEYLAKGGRFITFPFSGLDALIPRLLPGNVVLITGGTKVGKTAFAQQLSDRWLRQGANGIVIHFEDTPGIRAARRMARLSYAYKGKGGPISIGDILRLNLSQTQWAILDEIARDIASWPGIGYEVYAAGKTMPWVIRMWDRVALQLRTMGKQLDFVVIDYLNKAEIPQSVLRDRGLFGARGYDAELVKQAAERTGAVAILLQQENKDGMPFETMQSAQKCQAWISLVREEGDNGELSPNGAIFVKYANLGRTGKIAAVFLGDYMLWAARTAQNAQ